jgi:hypothetical protein
MEAVQWGFSTSFYCCICSSVLLYIADADYVFCPVSRAVSPPGAGQKKPSTRSTSYQPREGVLGLDSQGAPAKYCSFDATLLEAKIRPAV